MHTSHIVRYIALVALPCFLSMIVLVGIAEARIQADQVPHGKWRARAASINGQSPAADQAFSFHFAGGGTASTHGDAWSDWIAFGEGAAAAATGEHAYPNSYMSSWPLVVKMAITGVVDSTRVEVQWKFDDTQGDAGASEAVTQMHADLYGGTLGIVIWRDDSEAVTPSIATMAQYNQRYWAALAEVNIPENDRPKQIPIVDRFIGGDDDRISWRQGIAELSKAGFNGIMLPPDARIRQMLVDAGERGTAWAVYSPPGYAFDHDADVTPDAISVWAQQLAAPYVEAGYDLTDMRMYAMSDEPGWYYPKQFDSVRNNPKVLQRFHDYLAEQGLTPMDVGHETWGSVHPAGRHEAVNLPSKRLFYWTMRFFSWDSARHFANSTRAMEFAFYPKMPIFTNWNFFAGRSYVPGPVANNSERKNPDAAMGGHDWLEFGRMRGGTMMWTEDWFSDHQAYQWSFYCSKLRTAAEKGDVVFGGYVIPRVAGQRADGIVQKIMTIIGHGGKGIKYFVFGPEYNFPGNTYSENISVLPKMAEAHAMIGRAEDLLWPGKTPPRQVAILHPRSAQMWDDQGTELPSVISDATNTNLNANTVDYMAEVFNLYTALQHANIPVDFVEEQDLNTQYLSRYKVLYVTAPNIPAEHAQGLADWVTQGGHVVMLTGAATLDRYGEPMPQLGKALGLVEKPRERLLIADVNALEVVGAVTLPIATGDTAEIPVYGSRAKVQAADAEALASFSDGVPAVLRRSVGTGKATFFNFLPGIAYVRSATQRTDGLPSGWSVTLRELMVQPTRLEGVVPIVTVSEPLIEAPVLVSDAGMAITLLNWTGKDRAAVRLAIRTPLEVASVESLDHGNVAFERVDGGIILTLNIDAVDVLLLRK